MKFEQSISILILIIVNIIYPIYGASSIRLPYKVLVVGGSGRVGGSAIRSLSKRFGDKFEKEQEKLLREK